MAVTLVRLSSLGTCLVLTAVTPAPRLVGFHSATMRAAQVAVWPETERFVRDLRSKNVPDEVALFTPDAVFIDPGHHVTGTRSIRALCEKVAATFDSDIALTAQRHVNAGRLDFETGTFRENLRVRKTGHVQPYRGTYTFTLRRDADGRRRFSRMLWAITPASS